MGDKQIFKNFLRTQEKLWNEALGVRGEILKIGETLSWERNPQFSITEVVLESDGRIVSNFMISDVQREDELTLNQALMFENSLKTLVHQMLGITNIPEDIQALADASGEPVAYEFAEGQFFAVWPKKSHTDN